MIAFGSSRSIPPAQPALHSTLALGGIAVIGIDRRRRLVGGVAVWLALAASASATPQPENQAAPTGKPDAPFELKDGDRVVLLGGTFIERDQSYGYLETLLTSRFPRRNATFRNLGWSGDTVWGEARSRFGPPAEGFAHLKDHVTALKPTLIFVNYGLNESFAGKAGLPRFKAGLDTLLDVLDKTGARVVLITPRRLEKLAPPLPDPAAANARLADYVAVLRDAAARRKYRVVDLFDRWIPDPKRPLTDNGVHLTEAGYAAAAVAIARELGVALQPVVISRAADPAASIDIRSNGVVLAAAHAEVGVELPLAGVDSLVLDTASLRPAGAIFNLAVDGKVVTPLHSATDAAGRFAPLRLAADVAQSERLRATINAKNELYFYRWRPQNETYLFGFRKHEQGNNAREIPLFDPLVAAREAEIAKLRVPPPHTYEIIRKEQGQ